VATQRDCNVCGKTYTAKRATSQFCGTTCRVRHGRAQAAKPAAKIKTPAAKTARSSPPRDEPTPEQERAAAVGTVGFAVWTELDQLNQTESAMGVMALTLANRLDDGRFNTGSAAATLAKELRTILDAIKGRVAPTDSVVDELRRKREQRAAGE
jgi:hypothetical protein